jgi:hypothetical protein
MTDDALRPLNPGVSLPPAFVPENSRTFRCARLLILLATAWQDGRQVASLDRLAYYDFFADNPWVVIEGETNADASDEDTLALAGFSPTQLSYASTGQRFVSRRERIREDIAQLVAFGLVRLDDTQIVITPIGQEIAESLQSSYADGFRASATVVLRRLVRLPNKQLEENVERWLGHSWLLLDLLDDVRGADVRPAVSTNQERTIDGF